MGITILLNEHDMNIVTNIPDRVYVLDSKKLISSGLPEEVAHDPNVIRDIREVLICYPLKI